MKNGDREPNPRHRLSLAEGPGLGSVTAGSRPQQPVWSIGIFAGNSPLHLTSQCAGSVLNASDISDVSASFIADPFMVRMGEEWLMFFEIMSIETGNGEIGYARSSDGVCWKYSGSVLREPFHLSYPHVFEWDGNYFMVPEALSQNAIILYQALRFPFEWKPVAKLVEGCFADATPFRNQELWWMFACSTPYTNDTLRLYYSQDLKAGWSEHPSSPVVQGSSRTARPGGRVISFNGRLIRYGQDCDPYYGRRLRAFEIVTLNLTEYAEHECKESPVLSPGRGWNSAGMHHADSHQFESGRWLACVDGQCSETSGGGKWRSLWEWVLSRLPRSTS